MAVVNKTLETEARQKLCPQETWELTDVVKSLLRRHISTLPKKEVSETDTRYPIDPASMRAFLEVFFSRHYFQIQNSLWEYVCSEDFRHIVQAGHLQILDIGSGPAVASLAITDMLACVLECVHDQYSLTRRRPVTVTYVLNDTSWICLGTGQRMLTDYFHFNRMGSPHVTKGRIFSLQRPFPKSIQQIERIAYGIGKYDIVVLSYVVNPLDQNEGLRNLTNSLLDTARLCNDEGRILIVQDKYNELLMRRIAAALGVTCHKYELKQEIYPDRNNNETYTYTYYVCLYAPTHQIIDKYSMVPRQSPYHAVAFL